MCKIANKVPVVNVHYNANISQNPRVKDRKYICKEIKLYYLECPSLVTYEKQRARAHTYTNINALTLIYIYAYTYTHTHTHTRKHTHTRMHTKTGMRAGVRSRAPTHTKCSFVIGGQSLWNHLPDTVKEARSISCLSRYLNGRI